jgi:hypothetical protein
VTLGDAYALTLVMCDVRFLSHQRPEVAGYGKLGGARLLAEIDLLRTLGRVREGPPARSPNGEASPGCGSSGTTIKAPILVVPARCGT